MPKSTQLSQFKNEKNSCLQKIRNEWICNCKEYKYQNSKLWFFEGSKRILKEKGRIVFLTKHQEQSTELGFKLT